MSGKEDNDSDAPEEFTAEQGILQDQELTKVQKENKARVAREGKERRRIWAQRKTPKPSKEAESVQDVAQTENPDEPSGRAGMLPDEIVQLLAAREKQVFLSDSEDEKTEVKRSSKRKKKPSSSGVDTVVLNEIPSAQCLQNSLEFLKKRKMQVSRSSSVLRNSNQALRLLSSSGLLK
ncbi:UDP-N-acetylmuramoyl-L-alanyl-D-glutamate-2, 6-diaminopimelate ligase [Parasponia andersonii]|uniref:UDP-N-acetylmuramoyl-L-alanyl-D-glutamate-2, 6-diaminopimelate ligase n=1 Tax=Parasponia andersonii TaxID=3476 RepID=A0A2P5BZ49_PARAD|nr:UDP-N-acetylmuramoyl-L-alanyl-D-glutamate-2, 6-diaminopimelate ligase [Parasponia andersonii]